MTGKNQFLTFLTSLSMPPSIYFMWNQYVQGQYRKARFFCWLHVLTYAVVFVLSILLEAGVRYFVSTAMEEKQ
jgi:hypothetical protein